MHSKSPVIPIAKKLILMEVGNSCGKETGY